MKLLPLPHRRSLKRGNGGADTLQRGDAEVPKAVLLHASYESSWLVLKHLKDAHGDGSCSPRCRSLRALVKRRAAVSCTRCLQSTLTRGMTPAPAWHTGERTLASGLPTCRTDHLTQPQGPNVVNPDRSPAKAEWRDTHWADPRWSTRDSADGSPSFWCLPFVDSEERRPTWPQPLHSMAWASGLDLNRQIPPQNGWCFTFLLFTPKKPHRCSKQATTTTSFRSQWRQLRKLRHGPQLPSIPTDQQELVPSLHQSRIGSCWSVEALSKPTLFSISAPHLLLLWTRLPGRVLWVTCTKQLAKLATRTTDYTYGCSTRHKDRTQSLEIFLNCLLKCLKEQACIAEQFFWVTFSGLLLYTLISFPKSFKNSLILELTSRAGFQLFNEF